MKRCKKCGCPEFIAHQRIYTDIIVDGDNNFLKNNSLDDSVSIYEHESPYGPYECCLCGQEYDDLQDLIEFKEEYVGYMICLKTNQKVGYKTEDELIRNYEKAIRCGGVFAQTVEVTNDKNLYLNNKLRNVMIEEFAKQGRSFDDWIEKAIEEEGTRKKENDID